MSNFYSRLIKMFVFHFQRAHYTITVMRNKITCKKLWYQRYLLLLSVPFLVLLIVFAYVPLVGWLMAFQDYKPSLGFFHSKWVGFYQFQRMFTDPILAPKFRQVLKNTLGMSLLGLVFGFFTSITFAIFLNEMQSIHYKKAVQTIFLIPR